MVGRYHIRLPISDLAATTSCNLSDEEAHRFVNTSVSDLLNSLGMKSEGAMMLIQQLCGRRLILD